MVYEDLDAGDETRRNGDYVGLPHGQGDGTDLADVNIPQGVPVTYGGDPAVLSEATAVSDDIAGILANYDVSGDTGKETVGAEATVKMRGEVIADLTDFSPSVGSYLDDNADIFVVEQVDGDLYRVQVR